MISLKEDALKITKAAIHAVMPERAVVSALRQTKLPDGKLILIAVGKAAWQMANTAYNVLGDRIDEGIVITKYHHAKGVLQKIKIFEAGHPIPDEHSFFATERAIECVSNLSKNDAVLFLLSGGGSALFEKPLIPQNEMVDITKQMLACGADIVEINTIRKRLSAVKGGRFAQICSPAKVFTIVLSDIIGNPLDMIASGPAYPDQSTAKAAVDIIKKYGIKINENSLRLLKIETPKLLDNVTTFITGSVRELCSEAKRECMRLGYDSIILTDELICTARDAGSFLASIGRYYNVFAERSMAFLCGGETVVKLTGSGLGGRNQEIALSAAEGIAGLNNVAVFSVGSDGTDGPTDAAGGFCDQTTKERLEKYGISISKVLSGNDSYNALKACNGLIVTGPTGTNVNDLSVVLIRR